MDSARPDFPVELLSLKDMARMLCCSERHITRLRYSHRMPAPVKIGALVRWRRAKVLAWVEAGCPDSECDS